MRFLPTVALLACAMLTGALLATGCGDRQAATDAASTPPSTARPPGTSPAPDQPAAATVEAALAPAIAALATEAEAKAAQQELVQRGPQAIAPLVRELRGKPMSRLHLQAATVLAQLGDAGLPQVINLTHDPDPTLRLVAVQALFELDKAGPTALSALRTAKSDPDRKVRVLAAAALQHHAPPPRTEELPILPETSKE